MSPPILRLCSGPGRCGETAASAVVGRHGVSGDVWRVGERGPERKFAYSRKLHWIHGRRHSEYLAGLEQRHGGVGWATAVV